MLADKMAPTAAAILSSYRRNEHPPLTLTSDFDEIIRLKYKGVFFSYLGLRFSVVHKTVSEVEGTTRNILLGLEEK